MYTPKVWFVTGASSGFGRAVTEEVLHNGGIVVATLRKSEAITDLSAQYGSDRLLVLPLDVANQGQITATFEKVKETFGRLDIVFSNAGYTVLGEVEGTSEEVAHGVFEVNFWGPFHIAKEAIKFLREVNAPDIGRLFLQTSSMAGLNSVPGLGLYSGSKFAIEGVIGALRQELYPSWNIRISIIQPGGFSTRATGPESLITCPKHPTYNDPNGISLTTFVRKFTHGAKPGDIEKAAKTIYELSSCHDLPLDIPLGQDTIGFAESRITALQAGVAEGKKWVTAVAKDA